MDEIERFKRRHKEREQAASKAVRDFVQAAATGNLDQLVNLINVIEAGKCETGGGWLGAMRALSRLPSIPRASQRLFLRLYVRWGDHIRQECTDLVLADALWVLLPKYKGPEIRLYRGESFLNRSRRTYGLSWSASHEVAHSYASTGHYRNFDGGSVLLETLAPMDAIICKVPKSEDRYGEAEFIVDRRRLLAVRVIERFAQKPFS